MMKRNIIFVLCAVMTAVISGYAFSQAAATVHITVEVTNIAINGGTVYLAVFANAEEFRKEDPSIAFALSDTRTSASQEVILPPGHYVISAFQDTHGNQKISYGLFGIPKEKIAITNYEGKGFPSKSFDKQKIPVNSATGKITIGLYKL